MDIDKAWEIVKKYSKLRTFSEEEMFLYEEALNYILQDALEISETCDLWNADVEAGAFNLADFYEKIGKYDLAIKYYKLSEEYGCDFAKDRIERVTKKKEEQI